MARDNSYTREYACTRCKRVVEDRDDLTVKKASFHAMGAKARTFRSRVTAWLCPECLRDDIDWNRPAYQDPTEATEPAQVVGQLELPGA